MNNKNISLWFYLFSFIAGACLVFAFAPFGIYPIAWASLAVLFYTLSHAQNKKQHFFLAWLYGVGMFGTGTSWIFYSMHFYAHAPVPVAGAFTSVFVLIIALTVGLFGLLAYHVRQYKRIARYTLFYPIAWVLVEWFRGWFLTGFPWLYLGNAQIDNILSNLAPVTGVLGVSWLSALLSGAIATLLITRKEKTLLWVKQPIISHINVETKHPYLHQYIAAAIAVVVAISAWSSGFLQWTQAKGQPLTASLIQGNILQEEKWLPEKKQPTLDLYKKLTEENWKSDLIIWPETAIPDLFRNNMESLIIPLQEQAKITNTDLLLGAFYQNEQNKMENSVLALSENGRDIYSKQHLVPFSEYIPLLGYLGWLNNWMQLPSDNLTAGSGDNTLKLSADNIAQLSICYEDAFTRETLKGLPEANLLINVSNDGWFTGSIEPYQHMEIARMRALETGRYLLRSTNTGVSAIVNTRGKIIATAPPYSTQVITHQVQPFTGRTPFVIWGDWGIILLASLLALLTYFIAEKKPLRAEDNDQQMKNINN